MNDSCTNTTLCQNETITEQLKMSVKLDENAKNDIITITSKKNEKESLKPIIKNGKIYLITNLINNKKYVGITKNTIEKRFKQHCQVSINCPNVIDKAIKKYGKENFIVELIEECFNIDEASLLLKETFYIDKYNTLIDNGYGYNMIRCYEGCLIFSEETKRKMSNSKKGILNHNYGKKFTDIHIKNMSMAVKGTQTGKDNNFFGKKHTEETKKLISKIHKGKIMNEESKKKMSISQRRRFENIENCFHTDLTIRKFINIITNEEFLGNKYDFRKKYNLKKVSVNALLKCRLKSLKGWVVCEA